MNELTFLEDFPSIDPTKPRKVEKVVIKPECAEIFISNVKPSLNSHKLSKDFFGTNYIKDQMEAHPKRLKLTVGAIDLRLIYDVHVALTFMHEPDEKNFFIGIGPFGAEYFKPNRYQCGYFFGGNNNGRISIFNLLLAQHIAIKDSEHLILDQWGSYLAFSKIPNVSVVKTPKEFISHPKFSSEQSYLWVDEFSEFRAVEHTDTLARTGKGRVYIQSVEKLPLATPAFHAKDGMAFDFEIFKTIPHIRFPRVTSEQALWLYCQLVEKKEPDLPELNEFYKMLGTEGEIPDKKRIPKFDYSWCRTDINENEGIKKCLAAISNKVPG